MQQTIGRPVVLAGIGAGFLGGVLITAYLLATIVFWQHAVSVTTYFQYIASALLGKTAYASANYVWVGVAAHFAVSIGWGVGYAYLAAQTAQLLARPIVSGLIYGVIVYMVMQVVLLTANIYQPQPTAAVVNSLIAHTVFFGVPVAVYVSRRLSPT